MDLGLEEKLEDVRTFLETNVGMSTDKKKERAPKGGAKKPKETEQVHRFRNVFGKPLENVEDFVPPVYPKPKNQRAILDSALSDNFIFSHLDDASRETLLDAMEPTEASKGDVIIKQGDLGDYFYVIETGTVSFIVDGKTVGKGEDGTSFGELALLYDCPRAATVKCETDCLLWRVGQMTVRKIKAARAMENNKIARDLTRKIDFLEGLTAEQKNLFADALQTKFFKAGEMMVLKGEPCNEFIIIQKGSVRGSDICIGETRMEDVTLGAGDYFGQAMIESGTPWIGNATAETDGIAYWIGKENFLKILGGHNLGELIAKSVEAHVLMAIPIIANTDLDRVELDLIAHLIQDKTYRKGHVFATRGFEVKKPAIYLIRTGAVTIMRTRCCRGTNKVLRDGEFFGDDLLVPLKGKKKVVAKRTIVCTQDLNVGVLTLEAIRSVILDVSRLGKKLAKHAKLNESITLDSLKRYKILGAGTFGQVWLVSEKDNKKSSANGKTPYALKIQYKRDLIGYNQVEGVINEKNIMEAMDHPFVISLINTYKDDLRVYMLMQLLQGGELFGILHTDDYDGVSEKEAVFYAAGILEGLSYMHRRKILHRDLKGENVLMDRDGYCVLIDLGFAKYVPDKTYTCCGTPVFMAPEVLLGEGHNQGADYWSLGVLIYDMIVGKTPFYERGITKLKLYERISRGKFSFPDDVEVSREAKNLIRNLLVPDPSFRLGSLARGDLDIRDHQWFNDIDFPKLFRKELETPWVPNIKDPFDVSQFDDWSKLEKEKKDITPLSDVEMMRFDEF